jgi:hypothetical protein
MFPYISFANMFCINIYIHMTQLMPYVELRITGSGVSAYCEVYHDRTLSLPDTL